MLGVGAKTLGTRRVKNRIGRKFFKPAYMKKDAENVEFKNILTYFITEYATYES